MSTFSSSFYSHLLQLLNRNDFKSIGNNFILSSNKYTSYTFESIPLRAPYDSLTSKFVEMVRLLGSIQVASVAALQPILNICREFFNESVDFFGQESTSVNEGEWILRAATANYIHIGLFISKAGELEADGDERIGEVFHSIKKCLAQMNRKDESKRQIIIFLFAECFKLMFKLKRLGLFPSLLTSVQVLQAEKLIPRARKSDATQFLFYRALYDFHGQKFRESWDRFRDTWNLLHPQDFVHRRRVAIYLIAIGLCHGKYPTNDFLIKYQLDSQLMALRDNIFAGNMNAFKQELSQKSESLHASLKIYVFLLLNFEPACYLNLVKKIWKLAGNSKIVTFEQILLVANSLNLVKLSVDELECILITLIGKGWIKGHLGHDSKCLVLSPIEPFPTIL